MSAPIHPVLALAAPLPPPPIPAGWGTGPPDFVGLGAMRSGTTWWLATLRRHRDICAHSTPPPASTAAPDYLRAAQAAAYVNKEFHFFDHHAGAAEIEPADYHRYFPRPAGQLSGEWTPRYLYDFWTPALLAAVAPAAKLLVLLRDPVERYVSGISRFTDLGFPVDAALANDQFQRGLYHQQLANVYRHWPREQVLVLQYEQCVLDPVGQARRTFDFLGLDPSRWTPPDDPTQRLGIVSSGTGPVDHATRTLLRSAYRADLDALLATHPELDAHLWPTVATPEAAGVR